MKLNINTDYPYLDSEAHDLGFPVVLMVKNSPANAGGLRDADSVSGSGRSPGGGHGNPLQYSCLETLMGRGDCQTTYSP